jgi:trans-2,3-dihydro-3-hydroxyanthranilate isomerase
VADLRYVLVDVFTDTPLEGNQLAVFTDARGVDDETMQALAVEIGFSEITFVLPAEGDGHARVRIFNPREEMPFAGHPVLGTAFVLGGPLQLGVIRLETGVGPVDVAFERDGSGRIVSGLMEQPLPSVRPVEDERALLAAVGVEESAAPVLVYDNGATHAFVTLESEDALRALAPQPREIAAFGLTGINCITGTGTRWTSRMFWPGGEDPATGSAAGPLAVHVCRHGLAEWGEWLEISQGAQVGRPSTLRAVAEAAGGEVTRVAVAGSAVAVARGEFRL